MPTDICEQLRKRAMYVPFVFEAKEGNLDREAADTIESLRGEVATWKTAWESQRLQYEAEVSRLSAELEGARKKHFEEAARIADDPYNHITQEWPTIEQICEGIAAAIRQKGERDATS